MHSKLVKRRTWAVNKQKTGLQRSFYFKFKLPTSSSSSPVTLDNSPPTKDSLSSRFSHGKRNASSSANSQWHRLVVRCSMQNRLVSLHRVVSRVPLKLKHMAGRVDLC